jgi:hypothetical protein
LGGNSWKFEGKIMERGKHFSKSAGQQTANGQQQEQQPKHGEAERLRIKAE